MLINIHNDLYLSLYPNFTELSILWERYALNMCECILIQILLLMANNSMSRDPH